MSYLASLITNIAIRFGGKKGAKLSSVDDFKLIWDEEAREKKMTTEQLKESLLKIAQAFKNNKKIEPKKKRQTSKKE